MDIEQYSIISNTSKAYKQHNLLIATSHVIRNAQNSAKLNVSDIDIPTQ